MGHLVAAVNHVVPWRKPHGNPFANGARHAQEIAGGKTRGQQRQPGGGNRYAAPGDSVERQEQAGENERRPHVPLQEKENQAQRHRDQRR